MVIDFGETPPSSYSCVFFKTYRLQAPIPLGMILGWLESRRAYEPAWFSYSASNQTSCYMVFHQRMNFETQHYNTWQNHNISFTQKIVFVKIVFLSWLFHNMCKGSHKRFAQSRTAAVNTVPYFIQHDDIHLPSSALTVDTTFCKAYISFLCLLQQAKGTMAGVV